MKTSIWDILSILLILGIVIIAGVTFLLLANPASSLNPFPLPTMPPSVFIPTATETPLRMPPTWTPTGEVQQVVGESTRRPTSTLVPTNTLFVLPTFTPLPIVPTNTRIPLSGQCKLVSQSPIDGTIYEPGTAFTTTWTVRNSGSGDWKSENADIRFLAGDPMHSGKDATDLSATVPLDATLQIVVEMVAPDMPGYHITYWSVQEGGNVLCSFYVEILVKK